MKTGCLGPQGSYSERAAQVLCPGSELKLYKNFPAAVRSLLTGETDQIVLPIENTIAGGVLQNMDLLAKEKELFAVKEYVMKIEHRLVFKKGGTMSALKRVFSHQQALEQCSVFLSERLPQARLIPVESTAQSLNRATDEADGCIVGAHLCGELEGRGYVVCPERIADEENDFTYFELIRRGAEWLPARSEKAYFVAELTDRPGALYALLGTIARYGLNMTKIESRPIKEKPGEYRFFIEVEGDYRSSPLQDALRELEQACQYFKLLGAY